MDAVVARVATLPLTRWKRDFAVDRRKDIIARFARLPWRPGPVSPAATAAQGDACRVGGRAAVAPAAHRRCAGRRDGLTAGPGCSGARGRLHRHARGTNRAARQGAFGLRGKDGRRARHGAAGHRAGPGRRRGGAGPAGGRRAQAAQGRRGSSFGLESGRPSAATHAERTRLAGTFGARRRAIGARSRSAAVAARFSGAGPRRPRARGRAAATGGAQGAGGARAGSTGVHDDTGAAGRGARAAVCAARHPPCIG